MAVKTPSVDASAASGPRPRPVGKPVPRVGDDPSLASTGPAISRPGEPQNPGTANGAGNIDRSKLPSATPPRTDYPAVQRPPAPAESGPPSLSEVCRGSFFERNVCMDERCEEARFRSTSECVEVLNRKRKRGQS
jgi:hypothetical protein